MLVLLSSFGLFLPLFSVMMPASLLRKRTKTSPKYEQTEAIYFFIITNYFFYDELFVFLRRINANSSEYFLTTN